MVTERFADEMVAEMENYGKWAGEGKAFAPRLINMFGIGFEEEWAYFLKQYVQPLQQRAFEGYWKVIIACNIMTYDGRLYLIWHFCTAPAIRLKFCNTVPTG